MFENTEYNMFLFVKTINIVYFSNTILPKRINVRIEHVKHSNCRLDFLKRVKENSEKRKLAKETNTFINLKRQVRKSFLSLNKLYSA